MSFGVFLAPFHEPGENPTLALERDLQLIQHADALGLDEAWVGEHHSTGWELIASPNCSSPSPPSAPGTSASAPAW